MQNERTVLVCGDSLEGIYTGIYRAYELRCDHENTSLAVAGQYEPEFFVEYVDVSSDMVQAEKVHRTILREFGSQNTEWIVYALISGQPDKADAVYHTVEEGLRRKLGRRVLNHLANPYVMRVMELSRNTDNEFMHLRGFLRFRELENGVLYAKMQPHNNVMHLLMEHFCDRFPAENFIIHDTGRGIMAVHPKLGDWYYADILEGINEEIFERYSEDEIMYAEWFRSFCRNLAIKERKNLGLQMQMLPLRFRPNMTEFVKDIPRNNRQEEKVIL